MTFQRARSEEQRAARRDHILETCATLLTERSVAELTLTELADRAGMSKSSVLRYFDSREEVLHELTGRAAQELLDDLAADLAGPSSASAAVDRAAEVASAMASAMAGRPVLCDLLSAMYAVLERNVSARVIMEGKRATLLQLEALATMLRTRLPELDEAAAAQAADAAVVFVIGLWPASQPTGALLEAYESDPVLAAHRVDFASSLAALLTAQLRGLMAN